MKTEFETTEYNTITKTNWYGHGFATLRRKIVNLITSLFNVLMRLLFLCSLLLLRLFCSEKLGGNEVVCNGEFGSGMIAGTVKIPHVNVSIQSCSYFMVGDVSPKSFHLPSQWLMLFQYQQVSFRLTDLYITENITETLRFYHR
jgi:hypothetical protein